MVLIHMVSVLHAPEVAIGHRQSTQKSTFHHMPKHPQSPRDSAVYTLLKVQMASNMCKDRRKGANILTTNVEKRDSQCVLVHTK